jgi:drug/metabolite transporter (DMT)-like permease
MQVSSPGRASVLPLVILLTALWGTNWGLFPVAVREVSVWTFRAICLVGSGAIVLLAARMRGLSLQVPRSERWPLVAAGLTYLVIWNIATTYAAVYLPSGQAAVLAFTMPAWSVVLSWLFLGERPSGRLFSAVALASCGVALLGYAARDAFASAPLGFFFGLLAGLGWAGGTLILKRAGLTVSPLVSTGWQLIVAGIPITIAALLFGTREPFMPSWTTILVIAYITGVPMAVGNLTWFSIVSKLPATVSGLSAVMVPIVAMVTGAAVLGEPLGWIEFAAMCCCAAGMAVVLLRRS